MEHKSIWAGVIVSLFLTCALILTSAFTGEDSNALAASNNASLVTVEQYKNYLSNYSAADAQKAGVSSQYIDSAVNGAKDQLTQFNELSSDQQQQVVNGLNNPDLSNLTPQKESAMPNLYSGANTQTASMDYSWKPSNALPSVLEFHDSVTYEVKGNKVVRTTSDDNYVKFNYNPVVSVTKNGDKRHVANNLAYTWARWQYTLGYNGNGILLGNCNLSIWGDSTGSVSSYHAFRS